MNELYTAARNFILLRYQLGESRVGLDHRGEPRVSDMIG